MIKKLSICFIFLVVFFEACSFFSKQEVVEHKRYREVRYVMGSLLDITVFSNDKKNTERFFDKAFSIAEQLDSLLSTYKNDSEISRFNNSNQRLQLSQETCQLIRQGRELQKVTKGAFSLTIRPLVNLWEQASISGIPPSDDSISVAKAQVQDDSLHLSEECLLSTPGERSVAIETGGIGKGYAVDKIKALLPKYNIPNALINFGLSSMYAHGSQPGQNGWILLIAFPDNPPLGTIKVSNTALSASYSYGNSYQLGGRRLGHIIDPETGFPLAEERFGIVLSQSATEAEVLSKFIVLRGKKAQSVLTVPTYYKDKIGPSCFGNMGNIHGIKC